MITVAVCPPVIATAALAIGSVSANAVSVDRQRQESVKIVITVKVLETGKARIVGLTDRVNQSGSMSNREKEFNQLVNRRADVEDITRIEGMSNWSTRVKSGRAGPEEHAENWEDVEESHRAGKAGRKENMDEAEIWPFSCVSLIL